MPDPIDERLREIRETVDRKKELDATWRREFTLRANYAPGAFDRYMAVQAEMDEFKALHNPWEMLAALLDLITSLREVERAARDGHARTECGSCDYGLPMNCTCGPMDSALAALDATHRPLLSGET